MPDTLKCEDCIEHSGTRTDIENLKESRRNCREDRGKLWDAMEAQNRRLSDKLSIKLFLWIAGIGAAIFGTVVTIVLTTSNRIEDKVDNLISDVKVIQAITEERSVHTKEYSNLLEEIRKFREQEARDFQEGKSIEDWEKKYHQQYGRPNK